MKRNLLAVAACAGLLVQGCSSRPREFVPALAAPPPGQAAFDQKAFDATYAECQQLYVAGKLNQDGRVGSVGGGVAAGAATMAAGAAGASAAGLAGGIAIASATVILIPLAMVGGAIGMAKRKRAKKETAIQRAMTGCLKDRGYGVIGWMKPNK
jgi:hypothetical protein